MHPHIFIIDDFLPYPVKEYIKTIIDPANSITEFVGNKILVKNPDSVDQSNISAIKFLGYALIGLLVLTLVLSAKFLLLSPEKSLEKATPQEIKNDLEKKELLKEEHVSATKSITKKSIDFVKEQETRKPKAKVQNQESIFSPNKEANLGNLEKSLKLTIKVKIDSWFNMTIDNLRDEDFILPAGEEKSFFGDKIFRLTIGNNQGTEVILNGKYLVIPKGEQNIVKDFIITAKLID